MKRVLSKQTNVQFIFCPSPITIDKRAAWGSSHENLQHGPNGAFLKMKSVTEVSHLVQPNEDKTAPVGWVKGSSPGLFSKSPIWVGEELQAGTVKVLNTFDGQIHYEVKKPSFVCFNEPNGKVDDTDVWVQTKEELEKNYIL